MTGHTALQRYMQLTCWVRWRTHVLRRLGARLYDACLCSLEVLQVQGRGARGVAQEQLAPRLQRDCRLIAPAQGFHCAGFALSCSGALLPHLSPPMKHLAFPESVQLPSAPSPG